MDNDSGLKLNYKQEMEKEQNKKKRILKSPEDRKQEILDAALELFVQKGYSNTTIQDIADYIGVSQGLCYRYFRSKSQIFAAASEYYALSAAHKLEIPFEDNMTSIQKLDFLLRQMYEYAIKSYEFDAIYYSAGQQLVSSEEQLYQLKNFSNQLAHVFNSIIKQGIEEKEIYCNDVENTSNFLAYGMVYAFHANVPKENSRVCALNFIMALKNIFINSLQVKDKEEIGKEWLEKEKRDLSNKH